ncbi:GyrI-like domain-containing protein [Methylobacterium sp. A54F]
MTRPTPSLALAGALATALLAALPAVAQDKPAAPPAGAAPPPSTAPSPAETNPLPTTTVPDTGKPDPNRTTAPAPDKAIAPPTGAPVPGAPAAPRATLVPAPADADDVDAVSLPAKPAAILSGKTKWEEALPTLKASFARIEADLAKAGIAPAGRPIAVFTRTDDDGFQFEAMVPVERMPDPKPPEGEGVRFGTTPSGKALRFSHKGSYDEIDGTYETLTAYLDAKDVVVQDRFVEEYVTDLTDKTDAKLDVNIYALVK